MRKRAFTLIELLVVIAIIAILAAILFPVFAQAKDAAKKTHCVSNTKQTVLAALMYAGDWEDVLPRHDNNGSCYYGESPCDRPDWGDFRLPSSNSIKEGEKVMYFGAIEPYHKNVQISICPAIGNSAWSAANGKVPGINWGGAYDPAKEKYYYMTLGQMAINLYVIDWGYPGPWLNNRPGASKGRLGSIERVAEVILFTAESMWDNGPSITYGIGNGAVWPSWGANNLCMDYQNQGWTRYPHAGKSGVYTGNHYPNGPLNNPNLQGFAVFALADGHARAMRYPQAEKCIPTPTGKQFEDGIGNKYNYYYSYWTPEL